MLAHRGGNLPARRGEALTLGDQPIAGCAGMMIAAERLERSAHVSR